MIDVYVTEEKKENWTSSGYQVCMKMKIQKEGGANAVKEGS